MFFRGYFGEVRLETKPELITIIGIHGENFKKDIQRAWGTSRLDAHIFTRVTNREASFNPFFALEILYMVENLIKQRYTLIPYKTYVKLKELLLKETWVKNTVEESRDYLNLSKLDEFIYQPLKPQRAFLEHINRIMPKMGLRGYLLDAAVGSGKSYTSLALSKCYGTDITIIVAPKNALHDPWKKTLTEIVKKPYSYIWSSLDGTEPVLQKGGAYYLHYEYMGKFNEAIRKQNPEKAGKAFIILDECHNINEAGRKSQRSINFVEMCDLIPQAFVLWMSGTPVKALGREVLPLLKTIDPLFDYDAENRFREIFGQSRNVAIDVLANRLGLIKFKITKDEVMTEKPYIYEYGVSIKNSKDYTLTSIRKEMSDFVNERTKYYKDHLKEYHRTYHDLVELAYERNAPRLKDEFKQYKATAKIIHTSYDPVLHRNDVIYLNDFEAKNIIPNLLSEEKKAFRDSRSVYKYVDLKIQGEALGRIFGRARINCFKEIAKLDNKLIARGENSPKKELTIPDIVKGSASKTIFFTSYVDVAKQVFEEAKSLGIGSHIVYAETNKDLPKILKAMREDPESVLLIATFDSLSTAVPLIMCSTIIMGNSPFRDFERTQAIARAHRLGQTKQVEVYDLYLDTGEDDNISTRSKDIMQWSREQVKQLMGGKGLDETFEEVALEELGVAEYKEDIQERKGLVKLANAGKEVIDRYKDNNHLEVEDEYIGLSTMKESEEERDVEEVTTESIWNSSFLKKW